MTDWQNTPEIIGCNAVLRMAAMQAVDAVEQGRNFVVEGELGTGRRLLARSVWNRRSPGVRSLFTLDCRMLGSEGAEALLFGERTANGKSTTIQHGRLNLATGGGLLLLHAELLHPKTQARVAQALNQSWFRQHENGIQLMMTCTPALNSQHSLHPDLAGMLMRVRVPALRERVEDIRPIAEQFLRNASPFTRIHCSQALIDRFCSYEWPGNITELRSVLRRLLLQSHNGLLDVRHLADAMCRDESCLALFHGHRSALSQIAGGFLPPHTSSDGRSMQ